MIRWPARVAGLVLALVAATALATPAAAEAGTWTVSPGGPFQGQSGPVAITFNDSGFQFGCETVGLSGEARSGAGDNQLATFPASPGTQFDGCHASWGLTFDIDQFGDWRLVCDSFDGDVVYCRIVDVVIDVSFPGCAATITGYLNVTYTNSTGILRILPDPTLTVSHVDPAANCLGLITAGESVAIEAEFPITPPLTITSP